MKHNKTVSKILVSTMILSSISTPVSASSWWDKLVDTEDSLKDIVTDIVDTVVDVVDSEELGDTSDFLEDAKEVIDDVAADVETGFTDWYEGDEDSSDASGKDILEDALGNLLEDVKTELDKSEEDYAEELGDLLDYVTSEDNKDKIEEALGDVADALGSIDKEDVENAAGALEELLTGEGALSDSLLGSLGLSDEELSDLKDFYEDNKEDLDDLREYASNSYEEVADEIDKLDKGEFNTAWEQLEDSLKELAGMNAEEGASTALSDTLKDLANLIEASVEIGVSEKLFDEDNQKTLAEALNQISKVLDAESETGDLSEINGVLASILGDWAEALNGEAVDENGNGDLASSLEAVYDILASFVDAVEEGADTEIDDLKTTGQNLADDFVEEVTVNKGLFGSISDFVQGVFSDINKYINDKNESGGSTPEEKPPVSPAPPAGLPEGEVETPSGSDKTTYESKTERTIIYHENGCVTIVLSNESTGSLRKITRMPDGVVLLQTYKEGVVYVSVTGVKGEVELYLPYDVRPLSATKVLQSDVEGEYHALSSDLVTIYDDALTISVNKNFSLQIHDSYEVK